MRVDLLHAFSNTDNKRPWNEVLDQARRRIIRADQLGIDGFWLGEHHFDHIGIDQSPNPVVLLADLASRTESIRIGIAAVILPIWHPVRLAEDIALLDHMTGGRLDVALSRGVLQAEIINFNAEADRKDDALSKEIFAEHLDILRAAWTTDPLSWCSKRFEVPHPETKWPDATEEYTDENGRITGLSIIPKPVQPGGPALYSVTDTPGGFAGAAKQGLNVITWFPTRSTLDDLNAVYHSEVDASLLAPHEPRNSAVLRGCLIAPTDDEARALAEPQVRAKFEFINKVRGLGIWLDRGEDPTDSTLQEMDPFDLLFERDHLLIGSPETVATKMIEMAQNHQIEHWLLSPYCSEDDAVVDQTLRLLAEEVLPKVRASA
ncbi:LLM class flavin-dependent oxidoreductase [Rhodococcus koreensis]